MVVTDPSIDPITGLPVLNPSGPVQQIPLGQEVFPYADLNATAQPTRGPIYGDDIIPTSSLITAPDDQLKPRSIQSTRTRELRVREAVFQNLGAAIPDGTTAPVDVNVVSGGGGGGGVTPFLPQQIWDTLTLSTGSSYNSGYQVPPARYLIGWEFSGSPTGLVSPNTSAFFARLDWSSSFLHTHIGSVYPYSTDGTSPRGEPFALIKFLPMPIDTHLFPDGDATEVNVFFSPPQGDISFSYTLWFSDTI